MTETVTELTPDEIEAEVMRDRPEVRAASHRKALSRKKQMSERSISTDMTEDQISDKIVELAEAKAEETGQPASSYANGYRRYVTGLIEFAGMNALERYRWGREEAYPEVATGVELMSALAD